jgi:serine/threonine protein kinase
MAEIEDKVIIEQLRKGKILEETIINDVYRMYLQLKNAGDTIKLLDVFANRGYLSPIQIQQLFSQNNSKPLQKIGEYEILKKLGVGGMGSVFLAQKNKEAGLVAIKVLPRSSNQNEKVVSRFNREFRALQQLKHPAIISGIEKGFAGGYHFYVMEFFEGQTLKSFVEKNKPVDFKKAVEIIRGVAVGLQYASNQGMIHRDIKPDNIILTDTGKIKIIDFGLVKMENDSVMNLTRTQTAMGTPYFISCEQAKNAKDADLRSDIYSLGATLFYLITAEYPVKGATAYEVLAALISGQVVKPVEVNPNIPESLNQLILNMMELKMEDRYQDYESLLSDIDLYLKGGKLQSVIAKKKIEPKNKKVSRNLIFVISLVFMIVAISFYIWNNSHNKPPQIVENTAVLGKTKNKDLEFDEPLETSKEFIKYRIVNSFDREYKRKESMENFKELNNKLDDILLWLSENKIDKAGSAEEILLTRAFTLLAFCGAGYDFYQGEDLKMMEDYLNAIIDAQIEPGKWSSHLWVNVICTNTIIESFAMYGSDNENLSKLSIDALNQLEKQSKEFKFLPVEENILGSHLYITAFTFSRIAGLPKMNQLKEDQVAMIRKAMISRATNLISFDLNKSILDKLDIEAVSQVIGKARDNEYFLNLLQEKNYIPKNCREAYFYILFYGISLNKKESHWFLEKATGFLNSQNEFKNEIIGFKEKNGTIVTNAIAALAIENIYRIPGEAILIRKENKREGKLRKFLDRKKP